MTENPYDSRHSLEPPTATRPDPTAEAAGRRRLIRWIMLAVIAWGAFLAMGLWLSTHKWRGPAIVMSCVFAFLGFWAAMLATRRS